MSADIKSIGGTFSFEQLMSRLPELRQEVHPNTTLTIVGFAASDERRRLLNEKLNLGGVKFPHHQHSADGKLLFNTFVYPLEMDARIFRGRTNFAIVLDDEITDKFISEYVSENDDELTRALFNGLLTTAHTLKVNANELYFSVTL